jgi:hypothetical protein
MLPLPITCTLLLQLTLPILQSFKTEHFAWTSKMCSIKSIQAFAYNSHQRHTSFFLQHSRLESTVVAKRLLLFRLNSSGHTRRIILNSNVNYFGDMRQFLGNVEFYPVWTASPPIATLFISARANLKPQIRVNLNASLLVIIPICYRLLIHRWE